jgi:hypothetical protein
LAKRPDIEFVSIRWATENICIVAVEATLRLYNNIAIKESLDRVVMPFTRTGKTPSFDFLFTLKKVQNKFDESSLSGRASGLLSSEPFDCRMKQAGLREFLRRQTMCADGWGGVTQFGGI